MDAYTHALDLMRSCLGSHVRLTCEIRCFRSSKIRGIRALGFRCGARPAAVKVSNSYFARACVMHEFVYVMPKFASAYVEHAVHHANVHARAKSLSRGGAVECGVLSDVREQLCNELLSVLDLLAGGGSWRGINDMMVAPSKKRPHQLRCLFTLDASSTNRLPQFGLAS